MSSIRGIEDAVGIVLALGLIAVAYADLKSKMKLKAGDEIYACNCGETCNYDTMSRSAGNAPVFPIYRK